MERVYVDREESSVLPNVEAYVRCLLDIIVCLEQEDSELLAKLTRSDGSATEAA